MSFSEPHDLSWLNKILGCPCCRAGLLVAPGMLRCSSCGAEFMQSSAAWLNLYPEEGATKDIVEWKHRLGDMEDWYRTFVSDRQRAIGCFHFDYSSYAPLLRELTGCVLDLGGGIGVTRHFLAAATHYVVLDASLDWLLLDWTTLSEKFPCLLSFPCFVHGIGEQLPFRNDSFHAVLALWSLNHVRNPAAVVSEVHRVLVPGGRFIVVLEDMIPRWRDALLPSPRFAGEARWRALLPSCRFTYGDRWPRMFMRKARLATSGEPWPLQNDHIRILERDIATWINGRLKVRRREWIGQYLTFEFARPER
jgi:ubiquinone/menaquinone biosynthesis C-methylase UbiE